VEGEAVASDLVAEITNNAVVIGIVGAVNVQNSIWYEHVNFIFTAAASTTVFNVTQRTGATFFRGDGSRSETYLTIEELNDYVITTEF